MLLSAGSILRQLPRFSLFTTARPRLFHVSSAGCRAELGRPVPEAKPKPIPPVKRISKDDVTVSFARSSGAGGQNVNKVNTKVDMRFNLDQASWLSGEVRDAVIRMEKKRINKEGEIVITSQRTRSQMDNLEDALQKLQDILDAAWKSVQPIEEDPEKKKKLQKQKERGNEKRLDTKKFQADKKKQRRAKIEW